MRYFNTFVLAAAIAVGTVGQVLAQSCPGFRTQTQGGWGANPNGNNPGAYLHANFNTAFPQGITVGCTNKLKLTTAQAVTNFLPSGSTPTALPAGTLTNPGNSYNNVFAGQVVALAVSIGMDNAIPSFGASSTNLKNLVIANGTFAGWTVQQLFEEANKKLGGCASPYSYAQLNEAVDKINNSYVDGNASGSYLICPTVVTPPSVVVSGIGHILCPGGNNGSVNITVSGGSSPYTFAWSNGATTEDLSNIPAGAYSVTVTSANGATATASATVNQPASAVAASVSSTNPSCSGVSNGAASVSANGGTQPYTYMWSNGKTTAINNNIGAGSYSVTVTDANGCSVVKNVSLQQPLPLVVSATGSSVCPQQCNGSVSASASGGTAPYSFAWSNGSSASAQSNLCAGNYTVTVTDAKGCSGIASASVQTMQTLAVSGQAADPTCYYACDGSISLSANGSQLSFIWSDGASVQNRSGLCAGDYAVTVTNGGGCSATASFTLSAPNPLIIHAYLASPACANTCNGSIGLDLLGTAPFQFIWSNGATTKDIENLCAGDYTVTVTYGNGCSTVKTYTLLNPLPLEVTVGAASPNCANEWSGVIELDINGGQYPYAVQWNNGMDGAAIANLTAGEYCYTVTDGRGCSATGCVTLDEPDMLLAYMDCACTNGLLCHGDCSAHINLTVIGGTAPYAFDWSHGATTEDASNLCAGYYEVTITDANGCTFDAAHAPIEEAAPINLQLVSSPDTDPTDGICDGYAFILMSEQHFFDGIEWSNAYEDIYNYNLCPGEYCVTVTTADGCQATECIVVGGGDARVDGDKGTTLAFDASVYPNPNRGAFSLQVNAADDATVTVRVFDAIGREVMRDAFEATAGKNQFAIVMPNAMNGGYNVVVSDGAKTITQPVYINK